MFTDPRERLLDITGYISVRFAAMHHDKHYLKEVGEQFSIQGTFMGAEPYGTGHINDTYLTKWLVDGRHVHYIQQRINHNVFKKPLQLMENILRVTTHLRNKSAAVPNSELDRESLTLVPSREGKSFYQDAEGNYWRTYVFITRAKTYDVCTDINQAYQAAKAFGRFQSELADLPGKRLKETIPYFHHTPRRFHALEQAVQTDPHNRCASAKDAIDFCMACKPLTTVITSLIEDGTMPERIAHNDAKFNNVMIEDQTGRGICIIDLDTVMSGCVLYDFGDMVRTIAQVADEDERDLSKVAMNINVFDALVRGYLDSARSFLTPVEIEHLPLAGHVITFNIGVRFLTDYLMGDVYFKTHRPGHNLDRARVQFKMIKSMEEQEQAMKAVVQQYL